MRTPLLLDVPKDSPSRKQKLDAIKKACGIWTHYCDAIAKNDEPWDALLVPQDCAYNECAIIELIANKCRLLEESGQLVTGRTEREAIQKLIEANNLPICI